MLCKCSPRLKTVHFIDLMDCRVTDAAVQSIVKHCPFIEKLSLKECHVITDLSLTFISQLSQLRELDLSGCKKLTSAAVQNLLIVNGKLETLMLSYSCLRGEETTATIINEALLRCIGLHCPGLVKLHLRLTGVSSIPAVAFEAMITGLPALEELRISDYNKPNTVYSTLGMYCPHLKHVYIDNVACSDDDFASMCEGCPLLESLSLSVPKYITNRSILSLAASCRMLQQVSLSTWGSTHHITDDSLCTLFTTCTLLTSVTLCGLPHITDKAILTLLMRCSHLSSLSLGGNDRLTDLCIVAIPVHCPHIQRLTISAMTTLSHETLIQLSKYCNYIHSLELRHCPHITDNTLLILIQNCKHLSRLCIHSTTLDITDEFKAQCNELAGTRRYRTLHVSSWHNTFILS